MNKKVIKPLFFLSFAFCLAFLPPLSTFADDSDLNACENAINTWSDSKLRRYAEDNILYYDSQFECEEVVDDCEQGETPILQGNNNEEKIWNWIANAGITGVSDNSAVIAGILGNFSVETGGTFDPFIVGGGGGNYYGLFQTNDAGLRDAFANAGLSEYWGSKNVPEDAVNKAIDVTLNYLFHNFGHTPDFLNHLDHVSYTTGPEGARSYAELFLVNVERAVHGNSMLEDPKVQNYVNTILYPNNPNLHNEGYQGTSKRREAAETIYNKYASGFTPGEPGKECVPGGGQPSGDVGKLQELVKEWAWPEYHSPKFTTLKPAYAAVVATSAHKGGWNEKTGESCPGVDCGAFVYNLIHESGWDPNYPAEGTGLLKKRTGQIFYLKNNWQEIGNAAMVPESDLQPGDVAIKEGHVFIYVGEIPGFSSHTASASLCQRAPMAGREFEAGKGYLQNFTWFRKR